MDILGGEKEISHLSCSVGLVALNHGGGVWAVGGVGGDDRGNIDDRWAWDRSTCSSCAYAVVSMGRHNASDGSKSEDYGFHFE